MRRIISIFAAAILMVMAVSCERENDNRNTVELHAYMGKIPTKGRATDNSGVLDYDYAKPLDIALVRIDQNADSHYPAFISTNQPLTAVMGAPDEYFTRVITFNTAQFYRNESDAIRYASWYPADGSYSTDENSSTVTFDIDGKTDILYGSVAEGTKSDGFEEIEFNHALCQFNIYAYKMTSDSEDDEWGQLQDISVELDHNRLVLTLPDSDSGEYGFDYGQGNPLRLKLGDTDNGLFWDPGDAIPSGFDSRRHVGTYLAAPPECGYVTLSVKTSSRETDRQISIARNFQRGCAYDIVLRFTTHGIINAEVSAGKWNYYSPLGGEKIVHEVTPDIYYDLSAYMTANCYVVPAGNYGYSFIGNVKGKSTEPLTPSLEEPGYVDILWCDNPDIWAPGKADNYFQLVAHVLSKNRIMFKVGDIADNSSKALAHKGNLVIAAYEGSSTESKILWTWHIWLNDSVGSVGLTNGYLALNHNLGASAPEQPGLYYQWGRKDPFAIGHFTVSSDQASLEESVSNPTVFYGKDGTNWFNGSVSDFVTSTFSGSKEEISSIYDPCPSGYTVPDSRMWNTAAIAKYETNYVAGDRVELSIHSTTVKFPLGQGYIGADGEKKTDKPLFIWSISTNKEATAPMVFLYPESKSSPAESIGNTVYGGAIRCISKGPSTYKDLSEAQTANTYIISEDGYYKFKANVAGNGVSSLITDKGDEWDISGAKWGTGESVTTSFNPDKVDYLWYQPALDSSIPTAITGSDVCVRFLNNGEVDSDGYVYLEVENWKPGNLIVAAYKGSKILWSWQLWLTEKPSDMRSTYYTVMDRNLGATRAGDASVNASNALAVYGLYYQWGRKDPGPGPKLADSAGDVFDSSPWFKYDRNTVSWYPKSQVDHLDGPVSIKEAAENPDRFINVDTMTGDKYHWMSGYVDSDYLKSLWGYAIAGGSWGIKPSKTMYDPCPPGYMVSHHWLFWNHDKQYSGNPKKGSMPSDFSAAGSFGYTSAAVFGNSYVPLSGHRIYSGQFEGQGSVGYLWGSTPKSGGRTVTIGGNWKGLYLDNDKNKNNANADFGRDQAYGQPVRCLKQ